MCFFFLYQFGCPKAMEPERGSASKREEGDREEREEGDREVVERHQGKIRKTRRWEIEWQDQKAGRSENCWKCVAWAVGTGRELGHLKVLEALQVLLDANNLTWGKCSFCLCRWKDSFEKERLIFVFILCYFILYCWQSLGGSVLFMTWVE